MTHSVFAGYATDVRREVAGATNKSDGAKAKINEMAMLISPSTEREVPVVLTDVGEEPFFRNGGAYELYYRNGSKWFIYNRGSDTFFRLAGAGAGGKALTGLFLLLLLPSLAAGFWLFAIIGFTIVDGPFKMPASEVGWTILSVLCLAAMSLLIVSSRRSGRREWDAIRMARTSMESEANAQLASGDTIEIPGVGSISKA